jgi:conjugal transfer pilus assembly protein TraL
MTGCALGVLLASAYGRAKSGKHPAFALHLLYWHLPAAITGLKRTPPSHLRDLVG